MTIKKTNDGLILRFWPPLLALIFSICTISVAQAQSPCEKELAEAEDQYQHGYFDKAIDLANRCLGKNDLTTLELERSHLLLGKAYQAKKLLENAKEHLRKLLELVPNWRPDPENDKPTFRALAEEVIKELEAEKQQQKAVQAKQDTVKADVKPPVEPPPKKVHGKKWLWLGGGGAVAASAAAFLIFRGGEEKILRLPDPPALPVK